MKPTVETGLRSKKRSGFVRELNKNSVLFLMLIPGTVCLLLFNYLPLVGLILAFKDVNYSEGLFNGDWVGLKNFEPFFNTPDAFNVTRNTLLYNMVFIVLGLVVAVFFAVALNEIRSKRAKKTYQTLMFLPYFLSWVVVSFLVYALLNPDYGFINKNILEKFGMEGISWYNEPKYWPFILVFVNLWKNVGYNSVIYYATITGISQEYFEAAAIDGATRSQQIRKILLPHLAPIMVIMTILNIGKIFHADFGLFYQVTMDSGTLYPVTNVLDTYVFRGIKVTGDIGMSSAAGFYQAVVGFILVLTTNLIVKKVDPEKSLF